MALQEAGPTRPARASRATPSTRATPSMSVRITVRAALVLVLLTTGWAVAVALLAGWGRDLVRPLTTGHVAGEHLVDAVAGGAAVATALLVLTWFALSLGGAVLTAAVQAAARPCRAALPHHGRPPRRTPAAVHRLAALLLGAGLTAVPVVSCAPAALASRGVDGRPVATTSLDRPAPHATNPSPPHATSPPGAGSPADAASPADGASPADAASTPDAASPPNVVLVRPGDSLWRIAARHLGEDPPAAAVARAWPRWHRANRAVIGPDPDLVRPGQLLHAPVSEEPR